MSGQLQSLLRELRSRFEALYGPRLVRLVLFGSHARGDAEPGSDIDVLVVLEGPLRPGEEIHRTINDVAEPSLECPCRRHLGVRRLDAAFPLGLHAGEPSKAASSRRTPRRSAHFHGFWVPASRRA